MLNLKRFGYGLILTALATLVAYFLAVNTFRNMYYMSQLLAIFLVTYALLAWLLHLREDDFLAFTRKNKGPVIDTLGHSQHGQDSDLPEQKMTGEEVAEGIILKDGLVQRRGQEHDPDEFWHQAKFVLLWATLQLVVLTSILYGIFGIGARFFA